ncbi:RHS repeat protein [Chitinophaga sp. sic0106]|uniref:RHS repeat protein n=1 Tax=Chitinophaga sp. sic0106 TaxID=2854785 RepID=UPI001C46FC24|nr:RHS repeat-associated core domain-containing protein [Chitinophaga sp. sic0106]MBV7529900.1 hypothetical protein [Chitinophaga sp. sic0106]
MYDTRNRLIESALLHGDTLLYTREYLQNLMNTASASSQILSYTIPAVKDLVVANDYTNRYEATNSVIINPGFETAIGKEIEVVVDPNLPSTAVYTSTNTAIPGLASLNIEPLTYIYYDEYNFSGIKSFVGEDTLKIRSAGISTSEDMHPSSILRGLQTGSRKRILGTDKWITTTNYYDQKKRLVQLVSDNALGGTEVLTNCYDFRDKLVGKYEKFQNPQAAPNGIVGVLTTVTYDATGKVLATKKRFNDIDSLDRIIVKNSYNGVGNLAKKELGLLNTNQAVATQDYQYNVRGWLNGINAKYVADGLEERRYFGEVLRYDSGYTINSYNGSIAGMEWRGYNEPIRKSYGYTYDYSNRLIGGDYVEQSNVGGAWSSANVDYSVMITGYDANGNIGGMTVKGMKNGQKIVVDDLSYRYKSDGNKLLSVKDNGAIAGELGDFKDSQSDLDDYAYDRNGNQVSDANKGITKIIYNFMNMPEKVEFGAKGSITYVYDANGQKLGKIVIDNSQQVSTTTSTYYVEDLVYESDTLKSWSFKDGRMRMLTNKNNQVVYAYDFFVKDHLDNVRMVVKETNSRNIYSATMETATAATENVLFSNIDITRSNLPVGYPSDGMTNPNQFVARLNAQNGQKVGPSLVLRVMAGDTLTIGTQAFYKSTGANTSITDKGQLLTAILSALGGKSSANGSHGLTFQDMPGGNLTVANLQSLIDNNPDQNLVDKPKAYLNYVMFDDQYKMDDQVSGIKQVQAAPDQLQTLISGDLYIKKSGFLYIYTSNESAQDVYFDNLIVAHTTSPVMEETHYYPFGGTAHGLSSTALSSGVYSPNKRLFNDMELQTNEFDDGSGLDLYDFGARMYDANTGRFGQIDPLSELHYDNSPYAFALNNPVLYKDLFGLDTTRGYTPPVDPKPGDVVVVPRPNGGESYYSYDPSGGWVGNGMNGGTLPTVTATPGNNDGKQPQVVYASFVDGNVSFLDGVGFGFTMVGAGLTVIQNKMNNGLWQMVKSSRKAIQKSDLKLGNIGRKLGYFGALLSVSKILLKIADGQPISKKEIFDGLVGAVCAIAVVSNPVSVLVIAAYGVLDGTGSLDGIKAAVGIDDSEAVPAFDTPEILHNSLYKL